MDGPRIGWTVLEWTVFKIKRSGKTSGLDFSVVLTYEETSGEV